jgi:hypothetical protein
MAVRRKEARELEHRGPKQRHIRNNVAKRVDPGVSASQMVPVLLDYYSVSCRYMLQISDTMVLSGFVYGTRRLLHVRSL